MLKHLVSFLEEVVRDGADFFWEWPLRCRGWNEPIVVNFMDKIKKLYGDLWFCRMDGTDGLKSQKGNFVMKSWKILTSCQHFYSKFRLQCCLRNHQHEWLQGSETNRSAYYPPAMCTSTARSWKSQLLPVRWLKMLWTAPVVGLDPFVISASDQDPELPDPASPDEEPYGPSEGEDLHPPDDLDDLMESPPQLPPQVQHGSC